MATKPTVLPRWATTVAADPLKLNEPPENKKDIGWLTDEKPPAQWKNWLLKFTYDWIVWLQAFELDAHTWLSQQILQAGIQITQSVVNGTAVQATGNGTGAGVSANANTGIGLVAQSDTGKGIEARCSVANDALTFPQALITVRDFNNFVSRAFSYLGLPKLHSTIVENWNFPLAITPASGPGGNAIPGTPTWFNDGTAGNITVETRLEREFSATLTTSVNGEYNQINSIDWFRGIQSTDCIEITGSYAIQSGPINGNIRVVFGIFAVAAPFIGGLRKDPFLASDALLIHKSGINGTSGQTWKVRFIKAGVADPDFDTGVAGGFINPRIELLGSIAAGNGIGRVRIYHGAAKIYEKVGNLGGNATFGLVASMDHLDAIAMDQAYFLRSIKMITRDSSGL